MSVRLSRLQGLVKGPHPSRRGMIAGAASMLGGLLLPRFGSSAQSGSGTAPRPMVVPSWDDVPSCAPSATDRAGQGPFFIHDGERDDDVSLYREDIRGRYNPDAEPGTEMQLHLRVLGAGGTACGAAPLRDVEVYVWHVDAQGFYSGFGEPGEQQPDQVYRFRPNHNDLDNNARFCRGAGVSDANGVVSFRSIFPGWYNGRDVHVHLMVLKRGSAARGRTWYRGGDHLYTTQLYFEPALIDRVHKASEPYLRRTAHPAYAGLVLGDERGSSGLRMKAELRGGIVTAQMQLVIDPRQSRV
jgi:protocatechuate 3,4-dioxygenase beta subunit